MTGLVTGLVTEIVTQLVTELLNHHFLTSDSNSDLITQKPFVLVSLIQSEFLIIVIIVFINLPVSAVTI